MQSICDAIQQAAPQISSPIPWGSVHARVMGFVCFGSGAFSCVTFS